MIEMLSTANDIADYIETTSVEDVFTELIIETFKGCRGILKTVPIDDICAGDPDYNIPNDVKQALYDGLDPRTMPPIILQDGIIMDGNHRYRTAIKLGITHMRAYVIEPIPAPSKKFRP